MMLDYTQLIKGTVVTEFALNNLTIFTGNADEMSSVIFHINIV